MTSGVVLEGADGLTRPTRREFGTYLGIGASLGAGVLAGCSTESKGRADVVIPLSFDDLSGWADDDHATAMSVFLSTLDIARAAPVGPVEVQDWRNLSNIAARSRFASARGFFEALFTPVQIGSDEALFTAYYEPEIAGARERGDHYQTPIYMMPPDLSPETPYLTRADIASGALANKGLEVFWLADPVEAFFLEIQGSGRIRLPDGTAARVGFAGKNGHPYRAIGKVLVDRGEMTLADASAQSIKTWLRAHADDAQDLMNMNPSYVFFTERTELAGDSGPIGAMGAPVTAGRSLAVDPAFHPLGAPIWVETDGEVATHALMIAQDVGGAIKGAQRADVFVGSGDAAGEIAGPYRRGGRMVTLLPKPAAARLLLA